ncbi:MAG: DUF262 domain-containing protein [Lacunisphaera sp.]|nr:DUF262 domain-containing protein [Lacunisphaera sp.]
MSAKPHSTDDILEVQEETEDNEVYIAYDIASYPSDLTLSVVHEMWKAGDIVIPDFQRNFVWSIKQASLLIESFLIGLPVPQVFFYVDEANKNQVIDGQQRLTSVVYFLDGYFGSESLQGKKQVFRLQGLDENSPYAKKRFEDLSEVQQRKLKSAVLRAINIRQLKPRNETTSIYHIFERLNTGGTPLKPQEIRNCVFRGDLVRILRDLNKDKNWRKIVGKTTFDRHQKDVELILRIFGLTYFYEDYNKPMKEFLNRTMNREKGGTSIQVQTLVKRFAQTAETIITTLGDRPFHIRGPLNSSALDAVFATLLGNSSKLPGDLAERYIRLKADPDFSETTFYSTSDLSVVNRRFEATKNHLLG